MAERRLPRLFASSSIIDSCLGGAAGAACAVVGSAGAADRLDVDFSAGLDRIASINAPRKSGSAAEDVIGGLDDGIPLVSFPPLLRSRLLLSLFRMASIKALLPASPTFAPCGSCAGGPPDGAAPGGNGGGGGGGGGGGIGARCAPGGIGAGTPGLTAGAATITSGSGVAVELGAMDEASVCAPDQLISAAYRNDGSDVGKLTSGISSIVGLNPNCVPCMESYAFVMDFGASAKFFQSSSYSSASPASSSVAYPSPASPSPLPRRIKLSTKAYSTYGFTSELNNKHSFKLSILAGSLPNPSVPRAPLFPSQPCNASAALFQYISAVPSPRILCLRITAISSIVIRRVGDTGRSSSAWSARLVGVACKFIRRRPTSPSGYLPACVTVLARRLVDVSRTASLNSSILRRKLADRRPCSTTRASMLDVISNASASNCESKTAHRFRVSVGCKPRGTRSTSRMSVIVVRRLGR